MNVAEVWSRFLICVLLSYCGIFAHAPQDSLFEKALDAEASGDVVATLRYLEEAKSYGGRYTEEIQEILEAYYDALQMPESTAERSFPIKFWAQVEAKVVRYDEFGDSLGAHENAGESFVRLDAEMEKRGGPLMHFFTVGVSASGFFREDGSVLDTSRWAFFPHLEYSLQGETFAAFLLTEVEISEADGAVFALSASGNRTFFSAGDARLGMDAFGYWNGNWRTRLKLGGFVEIRPRVGFWMNASLSGRFDGDTSVSASFWRYQPEEFGNSMEPDSVRERYYVGKNAKLGPELQIQLGYRFNRAFSVDFWSELFYSNSPLKDRWKVFADETEGMFAWDNRTWNRRLLQGSARLKMHFRGEHFGTYLSIGAHFRRYLNLPKDHPEIFAFAYLWGEVRLGANFEF